MHPPPRQSALGLQIGAHMSVLNLQMEVADSFAYTHYNLKLQIAKVEIHDIFTSITRLCYLQRSRS